MLTDGLFANYQDSPIAVHQKPATLGMATLETAKNIAKSSRLQPKVLRSMF